MNQLLLICYTQTITTHTNLIFVVLSTLFVFLTRANKLGVAIISVCVCMCVCVCVCVQMLNMTKIEPLTYV